MRVTSRGSGWRSNFTATVALRAGFLVTHALRAAGVPSLAQWAHHFFFVSATGTQLKIKKR
jgi:hypothetical protein